MVNSLAKSTKNDNLSARYKIKLQINGDIKFTKKL